MEFLMDCSGPYYTFRKKKHLMQFFRHVILTWYPEHLIWYGISFLIDRKDNKVWLSTFRKINPTVTEKTIYREEFVQTTNSLRYGGLLQSANAVCLLGSSFQEKKDGNRHPFTNPLVLYQYKVVHIGDEVGMTKVRSIVMKYSDPLIIGLKNLT